MIAAHLRRYQGRSTRMEHYPEPAQAFLRASPRACLRQAATIGPATHQLVRELLVDHPLHDLRRPCRRASHTERRAGQPEV